MRLDGKVATSRPRPTAPRLAKHAPVRSGEYRDLKHAKTGLAGAIAATRSRPTV